MAPFEVLVPEAVSELPETDADWTVGAEDGLLIGTAVAAELRCAVGEADASDDVPESSAGALLPEPEKSANGGPGIL